MCSAYPGLSCVPTSRVVGAFPRANYPQRERRKCHQGKCHCDPVLEQARCDQADARQYGEADAVGELEPHPRFKIVWPSTENRPSSRSALSGNASMFSANSAPRSALGECVGVGREGLARGRRRALRRSSLRIGEDPLRGGGRGVLSAPYSRSRPLARAPLRLAPVGFFLLRSQASYHSRLLCPLASTRSRCPLCAELERPARPASVRRQPRCERLLTQLNRSGCSLRFCVPRSSLFPSSRGVLSLVSIQSQGADGSLRTSWEAAVTESPRLPRHSDGWSKGTQRTDNPGADDCACRGALATD